MHRPRRTRVAASVTAALAVATVAALGASAGPAAAASGKSKVHTCAAAPAGEAACDAILVLPDGGGKTTPNASAPPSGAFGPAGLQKAYGIGGLSPAAGATVAIVDAYGDSHALSDVNYYRQYYGLPLLNNGGPTFRNINGTGGTSLPKNNAGWDTEISLDLDMVSAICPGCNILLVSASSASLSALAQGVNTARKLSGVVAVSNSYGGSESSTQDTYAADYTPATSGQWITASSGDSGYGAQNPATYGTVVAVGGTSLFVKSDGTYDHETAWSGAGSGCSAYENDVVGNTACGGKRAEADVSAVADPNTGVAVYDTISYQGVSGWSQYGGTSVASPVIASVHALAQSTSNSPKTLYSGASVHDVTSGSNGTCSITVVCHAGTGWDGPTGVGSPAGPGLTGF